MKASISGFLELQPKEQIFEDEIIKTVEKSFSINGFNNINNRLVEPTSALLSKGETSKEIYLLTRLQDPKIDLENSKQLGLRFDLTVPFARYVSENQNELVFPFFRSTIGSVFRGERPKSGRFRQFTQADVDIVAKCENGQNSKQALPIFHDYHIINTVDQTLAELKKFGLSDYQIHLNNRELLQSIYSQIKIKNFNQTLQIIDKIDKLEVNEIKQMLIDLGEDTKAIDKCLEISQITAKNYNELINKLDEYIDSKNLDGLSSIKEILENVSENVIVNLGISRGLDYYTGSVFETFLNNNKEFGSISSGGRYDNLVSSINPKLNVPGVGMSIGITRIVSQLIDDSNELYQKFLNNCSLTDVVVLVNSDDERKYSNRIANQIRSEKISCLVSSSSVKFGKQIELAAKRGVTWVVFPSENSYDISLAEMKNIKTGEQLKFNIQTLKNAINML